MGESGADAFIEVEDELCALDALYGYDEGRLHVQRGATKIEVTLTCKPATYDQAVVVHVQCAVHVSLLANGQVELSVRQCLGMDEERCRELREVLRSEVDACKGAGEPYLCAVFERCADWLTSHNSPSGECAVCLCTMEEEDAYTLSCKHALHKECLAQWIVDQEFAGDTDEKPKLAGCPLCRHPVGTTAMGALDSILEPLRRIRQEIVLQEQEEAAAEEAQRREMSAQRRREARRAEMQRQELQYEGVRSVVFLWDLSPGVKRRFLEHMLRNWSGFLGVHMSVAAGISRAIVAFQSDVHAQKLLTAQQERCVFSVGMQGKHFECRLASPADLVQK